MEAIKIVLIGDREVGKSSLITEYIGHSRPDYEHTSFNTFLKEVAVDGKVVTLNINDTFTEPIDDRLRCIAYPNVDVFLICFSVVSRTSMENVIRKWHVEVEHFCRSASIVLVATKVDLREDDDVSFTDGLELSRRIRAKDYVECSSVTGEGVARAFEACVEVITKDELITTYGTCECSVM